MIFAVQRAGKIAVCLNIDGLQAKSAGQQDAIVPEASRIGRKRAGEPCACDRERIVQIAANQGRRWQRQLRCLVQIGGEAGEIGAVEKIIGIAVHLPAGIAAEIHLMRHRLTKLDAQPRLYRFVIVGARHEERIAIGRARRGVGDGDIAVNALLAPVTRTGAGI